MHQIFLSSLISALNHHIKATQNPKRRYLRRIWRRGSTIFFRNQVPTLNPTSCSPFVIAVLCKILTLSLNRIGKLTHMSILTQFHPREFSECWKIETTDSITTSLMNSNQFLFRCNFFSIGILDLPAVPKEGICEIIVIRILFNDAFISVLQIEQLGEVNS